jgi:ABC-type sugar transport system ATPase subunit
MTPSSQQATTTPEPILSAQGLIKSYPGVVALDGVGIDVHAGEFHGLLGENGAGKSTFIKVIGGAIRPDGGRLLWNGSEVEMSKPSDALELGISVLPQQVLLFRRKSVAENILVGLGFPSRAGYIDRRAGMQKAREVLDSFELDVDPAARMGDLPLHKQRLVTIALAIARNARLIIMDEPTASLNADEIEVVQDAVRRLTAAGIAVLYVTHRLVELDEVDRVTVLRNGRVVLSAGGEQVDHKGLITAIAGRDLADAPRPREQGDASGPALLELDGVRGGDLQDVSFRVAPGRIVGITGAEGSGIKHLGRLLCGAQPIEAGRVELGGEEYRPGSPAKALEQGLVYVAQDRASTGLLMRKSIRENCALAPFAVGRFRRGGRVDRRGSAAATREMMKRLKIAARDERTVVGTLSGGNQQKVLLARALLCDPRLLLLEEPTEGVDVGARRDFFDLLRELVGENRSAVIVSSDWEELANTCDSVLVFRDGRMVGELHGADLQAERLAALVLGADEAA